MLYDKDIREPLFDYLEEYYGKIRILEEKRTGRSRADIVMVLPEMLCGIEIKSDADSYTRLASQVKDYDQYFDINIIAVGSSHAQHVEEHVPVYWGIITIDEIEGRPDFYFLRMPARNPSMKPLRKIEILWRPELAHIQELNELPKYAQKSKAFVQEVLVERVDPSRLSIQISDELFERDYTTIAQQIKAYRQKRSKKKVRAKSKRRLVRKRR
ncbi:MAG: sce7726 family protein [Lachnospiraceae bacterium]|nr:sce7726 family protein [Lachnospiraceae bacterium]